MNKSKQRTIGTKWNFGYKSYRSYPAGCPLDQVPGEDFLSKSLVYFLDFVDGLFVEAQEGSDDGARAHAADEVEQLVNASARHRLQLPQYLEGHDPSHAAAIETKDPDSALKSYHSDFSPEKIKHLILNSL